MVEKVAHKGGKKNRKHKRSARSPAMQRYNLERRDLKNKARHVARALRQQDKARRHKAAWLARRVLRQAASE